MNIKYTNLPNLDMQLFIINLFERLNVTTIVNTTKPLLGLVTIELQDGFSYSFWLTEIDYRFMNITSGTLYFRGAEIITFSQAVFYNLYEDMPIIMLSEKDFKQWLNHTYLSSIKIEKIFEPALVAVRLSIGA